MEGDFWFFFLFSILWLAFYKHTFHVHVHVCHPFDICDLIMSSIRKSLCYMYMFLRRDEKEERKKQGQTNKQGKATQHTQGSHFS